MKGYYRVWLSLAGKTVVSGQWSVVSGEIETTDNGQLTNDR